MIAGVSEQQLRKLSDEQARLWCRSKGNGPQLRACKGRRFLVIGGAVQLVTLSPRKS